MRTVIKLLTLLVLALASHKSNAQIDFNEISNWLGDGKDSSALVVNFVNGEQDSCLAWGVLFNESISGGEMLQLIADSDPNFKVFKGLFLDSISYKDEMYANNAGGSSEYWNTFNWDGANWNFNSGLSAINKNGEQYGLSYTGSNPDWSPRHLPVVAVPVANPLSFTFENVKWWVGTGTDSAVLIIDFQDGKEAHAWGFLHDGTKTGKDLLMAIDAAETYLNLWAGTFLDSLKFHSQEGINAKAGYYWGTWTATNMNNWTSNSGISEVLKNGDFYGVSYTNFNPALLPGVPMANENSTSIAGIETIGLSLYPNPVKDVVSVEGLSSNDIPTVIIRTLNGAVVYKGEGSSCNLSHLSNGMYFILVKTNRATFVSKFIKE
jgi:hypothetical protein